jgi:hypothetical protein
VKNATYKVASFQNQNTKGYAYFRPSIRIYLTEDSIHTFPLDSFKPTVGDTFQQINYISQEYRLFLDEKDQMLADLQAQNEALQAKLADEAVLLDHADRQRGVVRGAAELLLNADEGLLATAEDEDLLQVDGVVAANGGGEEELRGRHCFFFLAKS